MATMRECNNLS